MQGFCALSAEATEDLGLDQLEDAEDANDESPLAPPPGGEPKLASSSDNENENNLDGKMEESEDQNPDSELSAEEDDDDGVYLTAKVTKGGCISLQKSNFTSFAEELKIKRFPIT
jgi:hypothetical protein